jgi:transposase
MEHSDSMLAERRRRIYRSVAEKRRIVELTFRPGASVPRVAQAEGVNSHQIFDWRRAYLNGRLEAAEDKSASLLPVVLSTTEISAVASDTAIAEKMVEEPEPAYPVSAIHIEIPGRARIRVENGADAGLLRSVLESLRP